MTAILMVCAVAIASLLAVGWVVAVADNAPNLSDLHPRHANPPTEIFASDGSLLGYVRANSIFNYVTPDRSPSGSSRRRSRSRIGASTSTARSTIRESCAPG